MSNVPNPGLRNQAGARNGLRIAGALLIVAGIVSFVWGITNVNQAMNEFGDPRLRHIAGFLGGFLIAGVGLQCLVLGFRGAATRYAAGETMPVVRDSAAYLTDGEGILGVGRTVDDAPGSAKTGPFCSKCGVRNDEGARFCDACGTALA